MPLILIIDDSSYMRGKIKNILKEDDYVILEAENGLKGLQMATTKSPDCILLDLIMPEIDGVKIIKSLSEQNLQIPIIVITADIQESTRTQCIELGASAVINKPPKEAELRSTIKNILSTKKGSLQ